MPLKQGSSRQTISDNIRTLRSEGKPQAEAVAIALQQARETRRKDSGNPHGKGGLPTNAPVMDRRAKRNRKRPNRTMLPGDS